MSESLVITSGSWSWNLTWTGKRVGRKFKFLKSPKNPRKIILGRKSTV